MNKREMLVDVYGPDIVEKLDFLEPDYFDEAIIGVGTNVDGMQLIYSEPCIFRILMKREGLEINQAVEKFNMEIWHEPGVLFVDNEVLE